MSKSRTGFIVDRDASILREVALPVAEAEIGSKFLNDTIEKMKKALHAEEDGVAIAAPQIGVSIRMFVVSGKAIAMTKKKKVDETEELQDLIFINPEIIKTSKKMSKMEEGCLSVRWLYGEVSRYEKISIRALDQNGKLVTMGASGLISQIFQHEIDHLNGILFIDTAENVRDLPPTKKQGV